MDLDQFECKRCGNCCCWPGDVRLQEEEVDAIAAFIGENVVRFIEKYTTLTRDRRGLTLIEKEDGSCIFYGADSGCRINEVKPLQCAGFPRVWNCPGWEEHCAGARALQLLNK